MVNDDYNKYINYVMCVCVFSVFRSVNMTAESKLEIRETFQRSQKAHNNKAKLVASLKNVYVKVKCVMFLKHPSDSVKLGSVSQFVYAGYSVF